MTKVTTDDVQRLARLSNVRIEASEQQELAERIESILSYVEQLSELDTENIEPTYQVTGLKNVWVEDVVDQSEVSRNQLLELAGENNYQQQVKVPKVL